ncbi:MAG TPA: leucyl aminopeptidase family protein [Rhizomicrobium sp.]|jgi:leucyl aminopeptidase|nr:leucyl aminopeptidase family protein [Rhizomicrobium sp.]
MHPNLVKAARTAIPLHAVTAEGFKRFQSGLSKHDAAFLKATGFAAAEGDLKLIPDAQGAVAGAVLGLGKGGDSLALATFSEQLPAGTYRFADVPDAAGGANGALAWLLGTYQFSRYKKKPKSFDAKLVLPEGVDGEEVTRIAQGVFLGRDLINTPPNDMGPEELANAVRDLAKAHGAKFAVVTGAVLLKQNYPLIHAVGRGSDRAPRLAGFTWGRANAPKVTLVGKGVCFDTGGYDLKPASGMAAMKKDMGGAATVLAIASMVMGAKLDVRLRVLVPAVENSVSGNAYRPSDVFPSRKGLTVEIGNTDAEGRLVLADALADGDDEAPELMLDMATLTGAARTATGFELPPFFTDDDALAAELMAHAAEQNDPMWRFPLWRGYETALNSTVADLNNNPNYGYAGAITAALFLNRFVEKAKSWAHFDIAAWTDRPKPGRRAGAEATAARAIYALLKARYGKKKR